MPGSGLILLAALGQIQPGAPPSELSRVCYAQAFGTNRIKSNGRYSDLNLFGMELGFSQRTHDMASLRIDDPIFENTEILLPREKIARDRVARCNDPIGLTPYRFDAIRDYRVRSLLGT